MRDVDIQVHRGSIASISSTTWSRKTSATVIALLLIAGSGRPRVLDPIELRALITRAESLQARPGSPHTPPRMPITARRSEAELVRISTEIYFNSARIRRPPLPNSAIRIYRTDDTARLSGRGFAAKPDRVGSGRVGRSSSGPTCERAGVARRWESCEAIAKVLLLDDDTIRTWYRLYEEDGIEG